MGVREGARSGGVLEIQATGGRGDGQTGKRKGEEEMKRGEDQSTDGKTNAFIRARYDGHAVGTAC